MNLENMKRMVFVFVVAVLSVLGLYFYQVHEFDGSVDFNTGTGSWANASFNNRQCFWFINMTQKNAVLPLGIINFTSAGANYSELLFINVTNTKILPYVVESSSGTSWALISFQKNETGEVCIYYNSSVRTGQLATLISALNNESSVSFVSSSQQTLAIDANGAYSQNNGSITIYGNYTGGGSYFTFGRNGESFPLLADFGTTTLSSTGTPYSINNGYAYKTGSSALSITSSNFSTFNKNLRVSAYFNTTAVNGQGVNFYLDDGSSNKCGIWSDLVANQFTYWFYNGTSFTSNGGALNQTFALYEIIVNSSNCSIKKDGVLQFGFNIGSTFNTNTATLISSTGAAASSTIYIDFIEICDTYDATSKCSRLKQASTSEITFKNSSNSNVTLSLIQDEFDDSILNNTLKKYLSKGWYFLVGAAYGNNYSISDGKIDIGNGTIAAGSRTAIQMDVPNGGMICYNASIANGTSANYYPYHGFNNGSYQCIIEGSNTDGSSYCKSNNGLNSSATTIITLASGFNYSVWHNYCIRYEPSIACTCIIDGVIKARMTTNVPHNISNVRFDAFSNLGGHSMRLENFVFINQFPINATILLNENGGSYVYETKSFENTSRGSTRYFGFYSLSSDSSQSSGLGEFADVNQHSVIYNSAGNLTYLFIAPYNYTFTNFNASTFSTTGYSTIQYSYDGYNWVLANSASAENNVFVNAGYANRTVYVRINGTASRISWFFFNASLAKDSSFVFPTLINGSNTVFVHNKGNANTSNVQVKLLWRGFWLYANETNSSEIQSEELSTTTSIWNGSEYLPFTNVNKISFRCSNPPTVCQPTNQNNATSQPIFRLNNTGSLAGASQRMILNQTWATAYFSCSNTTSYGSAVPITTSWTTYAQQPQSVYGYSYAYCWLNVTSVPSDFYRTFKLNVSVWS